MFRNEVTRYRMQAQAQQRANPQITERFDAKRVVQRDVKCNLNKPIGQLEPTHSLGQHEHRSNAVEQRLQYEKN
jgi:hypothetical protein